MTSIVGRELSVQDLPQIPKGWAYRPLEDLILPGGLSYGIVQPGNHEPSGIPILRVKNLHFGGISESEVLRVSRSIEQQYERSRLSGGEVLLSLVGSVGMVAIAPPSLSGWNVARAVAVIRIGDGLNNWVKYYLSSALAQHYIRIWQTTTVQATLNLRDVRRIPIAIPPAPEREDILNFLGTLDDKLAMNNRIGSTADGLVRSLYRWRSRQCNDSISIGEIGNLVHVGISVEALTGEENYIALEHMPRKNMWLSEWASADKVTSTKNRFVAGDILFGKLRPYFHKVGVAFVDGVSSTDILVVRPCKDSYHGWLLAALSSDEVVAHASAVGDGTRMPRAKWRDLANFDIPWIGETRAREFNDHVDSLINRARASAMESRSIANLREMVLPGLMSGVIRVGDAGRTVEDAK